MNAKLFLAFFLTALLLLAKSPAATYTVAPGGLDANAGTAASPWKTIQKAANTLKAGDTVLVSPGVYKERVKINVSGSAAGGFVTFQANGTPGTVVIDGQGVAGSGDMISVTNKSYLRICGFEIRNNLNVDDKSGIRVTGSGDHIEIRNNRISEIRGTHAMGITVYGTSQTTAITNLVIDGNEVHHCDPYTSETVTVNGNVNGFEVTNNYIHDVNNIGIDIIGGETSIMPNQTLVARNGVVRGNVVERCNDVQDGTAVGIYVDGGSDILVENNRATGCDTGFQVGAENEGATTRRITLRNNIASKNLKMGLILGAADDTMGRVDGVTVVNNIFYQNDQQDEWAAEVLLEWASNCTIQNNIFSILAASPIYFYWADSASGLGNKLNNNLYYGKSDGEWTWKGVGYNSFASWQSGAKQDTAGKYGNPGFVDGANGNFHLLATSAAINMGNGTNAGGLDIDGMARVSGAAVDCGPDEYRPVDAWAMAKFPGSRLSICQLLCEDPDRDGACNLMEYACGTDPLQPASRGSLSVAPVRKTTGTYLGLSSPVNAAATDVVVTTQCSNDGTGWTAVTAAQVSAPLVANGLSSCQTLQPCGMAPKFFRLFVAVR